ncbi:MAG: chromate efflux transporter [Candidatus Sumerlaeaceae bacterium]
MQAKEHRFVELATLFLKLGVIGFGGPAAHISMMEHEVVRRRQWMTSQEFLDAIGAANLIPGPTSTELVLYIGWLRAGLRGLLVAGFCFITPAALLSILFAYLYVRYGTLPSLQPALHGIQAAVLAIIAAAGWQLARTAARNVSLVAIGCIVAAAAAFGLSEIWALLIGGICGMLWLALHTKAAASKVTGVFVAAMVIMNPRTLIAAATASAASIPLHAAVTVPLVKLFLYFLMVGSVLYGSGYVLIAFLEGWLVNETHLLTRRQLLDAVAVGQFTPGPVSTTATFIGYLLYRWSGAVACTLGIFLPSFILVGLLSRYVPKLRSSSWTSHFLDSINAGAVGLILLVTARLGSENITNWRPAVIALASLTALLAFRLNATWLVLGGALIGYIWL